MLASNSPDESCSIQQPQEIIILSNIPWDLSVEDVTLFLSPMICIKAEWVHIPIDKDTGKTKAELMVEVPTIYHAQKIASTMNGTILKGRLIAIRLGSYAYLEKVLFPGASDNYFITDSEVDHLIEICKNYKTHFSRKCPERPFEYILSLLRVVPWYKVDADCKNMLFRLFLNAIECLNHYKQKLGPKSFAQDSISKFLSRGVSPMQDYLIVEYMRLMDRRHP